MFEPATGERILGFGVEGGLCSDLQIAIPENLFSLDRGLYLKVDQRGIFFDEAGWIEVGEHADELDASVEEISAELSLAMS